VPGGTQQRELKEPQINLKTQVKIRTQQRELKVFPK